MTTTSDDVRAPAWAQALRADLRGDLVLPDDPGYDQARRAWNLNADHRPAAVVLAENAEDVRVAVRQAGAAGFGVAVMATGHGSGMPCDRDGVLINTSQMSEVVVDPLRRLARVAAGAIWDDVVEEAARFGLASLPGSSTRVGVVGYTLGGGFGWLGRRFGLAAQSVTAAEIVTASGDLLRIGPDSHPDLFWAVRGGTGNFGIVTALEFSLHPVETVYAGNLYYPLDRARDVLEFMAGWSRSVPDELTAAVTFRRFPPAPGVPELLRGQTLVALRGCHCGDLAAAAALIDEARTALGAAAVDTFAPIPASALASVSLDPLDPLPGASHSELLSDLTPTVIDTVLELAGPLARSPLVMFEVRQLGGALSVSSDALSPMAHSRARFSVNAIGVSFDPAQTEAVHSHLHRVADLLGPLATGENYVNFLDLDGATPERIRSAYSRADFERLVSIKASYDPRNAFRFNRNLTGPDHTDER
jgi:FAD/FMN-containing dehydrogenase